MPPGASLSLFSIKYANILKMFSRLIACNRGESGTSTLLLRVLEQVQASVNVS